VSVTCSTAVKPSLIRITWGREEVIRNNEAKDSHIRQKIRKQINGKLNNMVSADENK
jgi:hypothetical protein